MRIGSSARKGLKIGLSLGVLGQLLSWTSTLFVVRMLNPVDFAFLAVSEMTVGFAIMLSQLGFYGALIRKKELSEKELNACFSLLLLFSVFLYLCLLLSKDFLDVFFERDGIGDLILINGILILISPMQLIYQVMLNRAMRFELIAKVQILMTIVQSIMNLSLVYVGLGYWSIVFSLIITQLLITIIHRYLCAQRLSLTFELARTKGIWEDVNTSFFTAVIWDINSRLDVLFIQSFFASNILGFYRMSKTISEKPVSLVSKVIQSITLSTFSKVAHDRKQLSFYIRDSIFFASFLAFPLFIGLSMTAVNFVPLILGEKWTPAVQMIQVLCLMQVVNSLKDISGIGLFAAGNGKRKVVQAIQAIIITTLAWLLGTEFSIFVALLFVFIGEVLWYVLHIHDSKRYLDLDCVWGVMKVPLFAGTLMALAIYALEQYMDINSDLVDLTVKIGLGFCTYVIAILVFDNASLKKFLSQLRS